MGCPLSRILLQFPPVQPGLCDPQMNWMTPGHCTEKRGPAPPVVSILPFPSCPYKFRESEPKS